MLTDTAALALHQLRVALPLGEVSLVGNLRRIACQSHRLPVLRDSRMSDAYRRYNTRCCSLHRVLPRRSSNAHFPRAYSTEAVVVTFRWTNGLLTTLMIPINTV